MKFLAMLKDSFYETKDFKLFYVMLGLSALMMLGAASFRFPRLPTATALQNNLGTELTISDIEVLEESWLTPHARYRFTLRPEPAGGIEEKLKQALIKTIETQEARRYEMRLDYGLEKFEFEGDPIGNPFQILEQMEKAKKASVERLKKQSLEDHSPTASGRAQQFAGTLLALIPGLRNVDVSSDEVIAGDVPELRVETHLNWAELPRSRKVAPLFGMLEYDMGRWSLGQFMFRAILKPLILYVAGLGGIIVAVIITAGFVPNMLQKGTVDLLLVKPISRVRLLCYKYFGGLTFVFLNALVFIGGTWIAFGFSTGNWSLWYLASVPVLTFYFAILYSLSVLLGVLTRGPLVPVLVTIGVWMTLSAVSYIYKEIHRPVAEQQLKQEWPALVTTVDVVHYVLPKPGDLDSLNEFLLMRATASQELLEIREQAESKFSWTETLWTSGAFIVVMLGLASWRFARRDY